MAKKDKGSHHDFDSARFRAFEEDLGRETDRGVALVVASLLDDFLGREIRKRFSVTDDDRIDRLFRPDGAVGTFSVRITMGYALGIYGPGVRRDLDYIREIRNDFAHHLLDKAGDRFSFKKSPISDRCKNLVSPEQFGELLDWKHGEQNLTSPKPSTTLPLTDSRFRFQITGVYLSSLLGSSTRGTEVTKGRPVYSLSY